MNQTKHFTTRRGFIAATGFGGVSLYGLWAAYGAAPSPLALLGVDRPHGAVHVEDAAGPVVQPAAAGGHGGHGAAAAGSTAEEFSRMTAEFSERYRMPDGSVYPRRLAVTPIPAVTHGADPHTGHADHNMANMATAQPEAHAAHGKVTEAVANGQPIDVLMTAGKWYYLPNVLRLDVGQPYRFRMMALDVSHGASIQFGKGGRMMRLQPGRLTETELTFERAGRYLMYCTVYCGQAHDVMQATIEVV